MSIKSPINVLSEVGRNRYEFRDWLVKNARFEAECWLKLKRGRPVLSNIFYYIDAVEEALCFGWIDSTQKLIDGIRMQRFSPRKKNSSWSELNKERVRRLEKLGLMTDLGREVLPDISDKNFKIDFDIETELKISGVWENFIAFPESYQRIRAYNVFFYKNRDRRTYEKALSHLIKMTKIKKMFGEWNDYGRLLNY